MGILRQIFHGTHEVQALPALNKINRVTTGVALGITTPAWMTIRVSVYGKGCGIIPFMERAHSPQFSTTTLKFRASLLGKIIQLHPG